MYNYYDRMKAMQDLGVVGIDVFIVPNERPRPGQKMADAEELKVQNDQGFLGIFDSKKKMTFALSVGIERRDDLFIVWTEGRNREIRTLADQNLGGKTALHSKRVPTDSTLAGDFVTKSNDQIGNGVWVISTKDGQLQMWEVAIVTSLSGGIANQYLSLQRVYAATMYRKDNSIYISKDDFANYDDWKSLQEFLGKVVDYTTLAYLPLPSEEVTEPKKLGKGQAEIVWFNQAKGFGFARADGYENNPILHRNCVVAGKGQFPAFELRQIIRYERIEATPNGGARFVGVQETPKF